MPDMTSSDPARAMATGVAQRTELSRRFPAPSTDLITSWPDYVVDALQRSVLFLDLLRQRGDEEVEITSRPMATVSKLWP